MLGRGMRLAAGKTDCLILDYVGNLVRLGGVGTMESWSKEKQGKLEAVDPKEVKDRKAPQKGPREVALQAIDPMLDRAQGMIVHVKKCAFVVRPSGRQPGKSILMSVYDCESDQGISIDVTQFICVEYEGGARWHAEQWAKRRGYTNGPAFPREAHKARVECYALPIPRRLQVRREHGHMNVLKEFF
jgi:superfamily II DNA or RNA helicase